MPVSPSYRISISIEGNLDAAWWADCFAGLAVDREGVATTRISGEVPDQAAVLGVLGAIRDTGLSFVSVSVERRATEAPSAR